MNRSNSINLIAVQSMAALMFLLSFSAWSQVQYRVVHLSETNDFDSLAQTIIEHSAKVNAFYVQSKDTTPNIEIALAKMEQDLRADLTSKGSSQNTKNEWHSFVSKQVKQPEPVINTAKAAPLIKKPITPKQVVQQQNKALPKKVVQPIKLPPIAALAKVKSQPKPKVKQLKRAGDGPTIQDAIRHIALSTGWTPVFMPGDEEMLNTPIDISGHRLQTWNDLKKIAPDLIKLIQEDDKLHRVRVVPYG